MSQVLGASPPATFQRSVPANTRVNYVSYAINQPFIIEKIRIAFALNTQRTLQLSFYVIDQPSVANDVIPFGVDLLAGTGLDNYITGDGQEGEIPIRIGKKFPGKKYLCISANNTDVSPHTLDAVVDLQLLDKWS